MTTPTILRPAAEQHGDVFSRGLANRRGYDDRAIHAMCRRGEWRRLRRGAYVPAGAYDAADELGRHRLLMHAVALSLGDRAAMSHYSGALLHGMTLWDADLSRVHVTRLDDGASRIEADVRHHRAVVAAEDVVAVDDFLTFRPARIVAESLCIGSFETGLVLADSALHAGLAQPDEIRELVDANRTWRGSRTAGAVVARMDGRSESAGESLLRALMLDLDFPAPELQYPIFEPGEVFVGRVDFLFRDHDTVVEFDGRAKYGADGETAAEAVFAEKRREDRIRAQGFQVVRFVWADLYRPAYVRSMLIGAFTRAARSGTRPRLLPRP